MTLTSKEKQTLLAIYKFVSEQGERDIATPDPPSIRELVPMIGVASTCTVSYRVRKLQAHGLVAKQDHVNGRVTRLTTTGLKLAKELA